MTDRVPRPGMPRPLMVIARFYPTVGGAERQAFKLSKALVARGVPVQVVTGTSPAILPTHERLDSLSIRRYPAWRSYIFGLASALWQLRHTYDLIHVHQMLYPAWVSGVMGRWLSKPVIVKVSNSRERFDLRLLEASLPVAGRLMAAAMPGLVARAVAIATPVADDLLSAGFSLQQIARIPNGVELPPLPSDQVRQSARRRLGAPDGLPLLVYTGTYSPKKNLPLLLRAVSRVKERGRSCRLWLVGDGPERGRLEALAARLGLRDTVTFIGFVDDVRPYLQAADIFTLSSRVEGLSNSLLEAMAHGLPVVATDAGGNRDAVEDGVTGFLVPPGDVEALANQLETLLDNPALQRQMGAAGRHRVETNYDIELIAGRFIRLYRELVRLH